MRPFNHGFFPGLLLGVALAVPSRAADNTPTLDSVLARFVEASGGKVAMDKITSRTLKGDLDLMGSTSDWVMYAKPPNKQLSECKHATLGTLVDGFDGTVAWSKTDAGIRVKEGEELAKTRRDAEFYRYQNLKKLYPDLAYKGTDKVGDEEVNVLESKPSASSKERFFFSAKSGLLVRQESELEGPQGRLSLSARLDDFRAVDGIKYAHSLQFKINSGGQDFEFAIKLKEVKHNAAIEDSKFAKPAE